MVLLWFIAGILLALCIARYNENNKLFWRLMLAFTLGYAITVMVNRITSNNEQNNKELVQTYPTQMSSVMFNGINNHLTKNIAPTPTKVTALESVIQDYASDDYENHIVLSEVYGRTRDQPIFIIEQPPECLTKDISTHHDSG